MKEFFRYLMSDEVAETVYVVLMLLLLLIGVFFAFIY